MRNKSKTTSGNNSRGGRGFKKSNFNASKNAKNGKPDKTKGLESHACDTGKSECHVETTEFMLSHMRQECELGNDIATATEDGEEKDFTASMPIMQVIAEPRCALTHCVSMDHLSWRPSPRTSCAERPNTSSDANLKVAK